MKEYLFTRHHPHDIQWSPYSNLVEVGVGSLLEPVRHQYNLVVPCLLFLKYKYRIMITGLPVCVNEY